VLSWTADGNLRAVAMHAGAIKSSKPLRHPVLSEVISALVGMGWKPLEAEQACSELVLEEGATIEALIRQALRSMPR
jgi:Holliday junction resolvasome RuvABC DNA-binding subunit